MSVRESARSIIKAALPATALSALQRWRRSRILAATAPISRCFGLDRGGHAIDRHYIEAFLAEHAQDIHGRVLEVGDRGYTERFGGERVTTSDVLHVNPGHPGATIIGDLATGSGIPAETFDCMICTQTLLFIYDVRSAAKNICRLLRPGGVALITLPCIAQIARWGASRWGDYWRFTSLGAQRLFADAFGERNVQVRAFGNSFAAICMLQGVTLEEMTLQELDQNDPDYQIIVGVRATRDTSEHVHEESRVSARVGGG